MLLLFKQEVGVYSSGVNDKSTPGPGTQMLSIPCAIKVGTNMCKVSMCPFATNSIAPICVGDQ